MRRLYGLRLSLGMHLWTWEILRSLWFQTATAFTVNNFGKFLSDCYDITLYRTPPRMPNCNAYIERCNRTVCEELLDHRIIFGERDLHRLLREYVDYFNQSRPHQSLGQDSPCRQHEVVGFERSKVRRKRLVDGLIVNYSMAA
jgi:putative transposase